jgi:hypothetical protein
MKEFFKKIYRPILFMIVSVFVLSIPIQDKALYFYARQIFVDNSLVTLFCDHTSALYNQLVDKVRLAIVEGAAPKQKAVN